MKRIPDFDRLKRDLLRAEEAWRNGEQDKSRRILKVIGSIALADSEEHDPNAPVIEVRR
jgi:hypothetical protein